VDSNQAKCECWLLMFDACCCTPNAKAADRPPLSGLGMIRAMNGPKIE